MCAVCPKCKKIIDHLIEVCSGFQKDEIFFNKEKGYIDWRNDEFNSDGTILEYQCPECYSRIVEEQDVEDFLKEDDGVAEAITEVLNKKENK